MKKLMLMFAGACAVLWCGSAAQGFFQIGTGAAE